MHWEDLPITIQQRVHARQGYASQGRQRDPAGTELAGMRSFQMGDTPRMISRRHLAKYGELRVIEKFPDRRAAVLFLADCSASGTLGLIRRKHDLVFEIIAGIGTACLGKGHIVKLIAFTDSVEEETGFFTSKRRWHEELSRVRHLPFRSAQTDPRSALERAWELCRIRRSGDLVCLVSDFLFPHPYSQILAELQDTADIVAVAVTDPMEDGTAKKNAAVYRVRDVETGTILLASGIEQIHPWAYLDELGIDRCVLRTNDDEFRQFQRLQELFLSRIRQDAVGKGGDNVS